MLFSLIIAMKLIALILIPSLIYAIVEIDNFPATESHFKPIKHQVTVSTVSHSNDSYSCYNFETCQIVSSKVTTKQKR